MDCDLLVCPICKEENKERRPMPSLEELLRENDITGIKHWFDDANAGRIRNVLTKGG
jgi:hypothetical protein